MNILKILVILAIFVPGMAFAQAPSLLIHPVEAPGTVVDEPGVIGVPACISAPVEEHFALAEAYITENYSQYTVVEESASQTGPCNNMNIAWTKFEVTDSSGTTVGEAVVNGDTEEVEFTELGTTDTGIGHEDIEGSEGDDGHMQDVGMPGVEPTLGDDGYTQDVGMPGTEPTPFDGEADDKEETKESGEKAGTEDINIGVGELQETGTAGEEIVADEHGAAAPDSFFDIFVDLGDEDTQAAIDAFLKIDDIEGEAIEGEAMDDDDEVGEVRFGDGERGARPSKPKEIVVVGSKVREVLEESEVEIRGWDPINKEVTIDPDDIDEEEDFLDFIGATTASDENIEEVSFYFNKIEMKYGQPAKLFGFFDITMTAETEIDEAGEVKVKFPWYRFLTKNNVKELRAQVEEATQTMAMEQEQEQVMHEETDLEFLRERARMFQTMSNIMKAAHDTAKAAIQNVR